MDHIKRFSFSSGWAFDTGSRIFHAVSLPPLYSWVLVEFTDDARMPEVGSFKKLDDCEMAIRQALANNTHFQGDCSLSMENKLKLDSAGGGSYFFDCRRRSFHVAQCWQGDPWHLTEALPIIGFFSHLGTRRTLAEAKTHLLNICDSCLYMNPLTSRDPKTIRECSTADEFHGLFRIR